MLSPDIVLRKRTTFPLRFRFVLGSIPRYPADAAKAPTEPCVPMLRALTTGPILSRLLRKHRFP